MKNKHIIIKYFLLFKHDSITLIEDKKIKKIKDKKRYVIKRKLQKIRAA